MGIQRHVLAPVLYSVRIRDTPVSLRCDSGKRHRLRTVRRGAPCQSERPYFILDRWTTELLYLESVINHYQTVDYNFECRENQCHAGKTCKLKTIYTCIYWQIAGPSKHAGGKNTIYRFFGFYNRFSVFSVF